MVGEWLYQEHSFAVFLLLTVVLGGGAGWLAGRAAALTWRPWWMVVVYALLIGLAVRFFHFALFEGTLLAPYYYGVDALVALVFALGGYRLTRARQMTRQYGFLRP